MDIYSFQQRHFSGPWQSRWWSKSQLDDLMLFFSVMQIKCGPVSLPSCPWSSTAAGSRAPHRKHALVDSINIVLGSPANVTGCFCRSKRFLCKLPVSHICMWVAWYLWPCGFALLRGVCTWIRLFKGEDEVMNACKRNFEATVVLFQIITL